MTRSSVWGAVALLVGLMFVVIAQQILGEGTAHDAFLWLGVLLVVANIGQRLLVIGKAPPAARGAERALLFASTAVLVGLGLYGMSTDAGLDLLGYDGAGQESGLGPIFGVLWPSFMAVGGSALLFMELAYRRMPIPEAVEPRRIRTAAFDGMAIALSLIFVFSMNYVAHERDWRKDLTYFKTSQPSDTATRMVQSLTEPVHVVLFYPEVNDVREQVEPYFRTLAAASEDFDYEVRDHALAPEIAREHRISGNGNIVLLRGEGDGQQAESFDVGTELEVARSRLRTLDGRFQRTFARLVMQRREMHLTTGHDERTQSGVEGAGAGESTRDLMDALSRSNIVNEPLGMAQGLANEVPAGAPAVAVVGPRKAFLPEEADSLLRYVQGGGRLLVMVDPDVDHGLGPLLQGLGVTIRDGILASERDHVRRTGTLADRTLVRTSHYSSHPTVTMVSRNASQVASVFVRGGAVSRYEGPGAPEGATVDFPLRSGDGFFLDTNGDFNRDGTEESGRMEMIAAVTLPAAGDGEDGRAVIIPDGDFVTDQVIRNPGNVLLFGDVIQWLIGQEQIVGEVSSEEDVRIEHSAEEDKLWFWATSFGAPLPFFAIAIWVGLRRSRRGSRRGPAPGAPREAAAAARPKKEEDDEPDEPDEPDGGDEPDGDDDQDEDDEQDEGDEQNKEEGTP